MDRLSRTGRIIKQKGRRELREKVICKSRQRKRSQQKKQKDQERRRIRRKKDLGFLKNYNLEDRAPIFYYVAQTENASAGRSDWSYHTLWIQA